MGRGKIDKHVDSMRYLIVIFLFTLLFLSCDDKQDNSTSPESSKPLSAKLHAKNFSEQKSVDEYLVDLKTFCEKYDGYTLAPTIRKKLWRYISNNEVEAYFEEVNDEFRIGTISTKGEPLDSATLHYFDSIEENSMEVHFRSPVNIVWDLDSLEDLKNRLLPEFLKLKDEMEKNKIWWFRGDSIYSRPDIGLFMIGTTYKDSNCVLLRNIHKNYNIREHELDEISDRRDCDALSYVFFKARTGTDLQSNNYLNPECLTINDKGQRVLDTNNTCIPTTFSLTDSWYYYRSW
jgi:hypothetical protein